jgi:drug/metabolite transporter (DMT)-like permease
MARSSVDGFGAATMLLLCATWGAQQVAIKLAAPDVAPVAQVAMRYVLSAALVVGFMAWRREAPAWRRTWRPGLVAGVLFAVEFLFIAEGLRHTSAGHMAVFLYTAPVFTAVGLHLSSGWRSASPCSASPSRPPSSPARRSCWRGS